MPSLFSTPGKIKPVTFEANFGYIRLPADTYQEAYMMEKNWLSLQYVSMEPEDFNSVLDMLSSEDSESHMLATKILLNNVKYDVNYLATNVTPQGRILENNKDIHSNIAHSIAKITTYEIQSLIPTSEKTK